MLTKNSLATETMIFLLKIGSIYKSDLSLWISHRSPSKRNYSTHLIERLKQRELITADEVVRNSKKGSSLTETVISLSAKGKSAALEYLDDDYYRSYYSAWEKPFHTINADKLNMALSFSTIAMLFDCTETAVFPDEKPSLYHLYATLGMVQRKEKQTDSMYQNNMSQQQCHTLLEKGIYYSSGEYREFANTVSPGKADTYKGSRFRGIFISLTDTFVLYISNRGENRILKMNYEMEKSLIEQIIQDIGSFTELNRLLQGFTKNGHPVHNSPHAIVFSEGNSLVYSMTLGNPHGHIRNNDLREVNDQRKKVIENKKKESSSVKYGHVFFDSTSDLFERVFVIPNEENGIRMLSWLTQNSFEDWQKESVSLFKDNKHYFTVTEDPIYPYCELVSNYRIPAIYLPVYEIKEMDYMSTLNYSPTVLTYQDMAETIAHCNRKASRYYDASYKTGERKRIAALYFGNDFTNIYDESGYIQGQKMIMDYLKKQHLDCKDMHLQFFHLYKKFNYENSIAFFNDIYRGILSVSDVAEKMETSKKEEHSSTKRKKPVRKSITITLSPEMVRKYKKAAGKYNMSVQQYVLCNMYDQVLKDSQDVQDKLTEKRAEWHLHP